MMTHKLFEKSPKAALLLVLALVLLMLAGTFIAVSAQANYENEARAFLAELVADKFDVAAARFDETIAKLMPAPKLAETWQGLLSQVGKFQEVKGVQLGEQSGYHVVILSSQFERALIRVRVVFNNKMQIAGLFFAPGESPAANWTPAPSVKPDSFEERDVTVGVAPWTLPGKLTVPKGAGPYPGIVLVHGSGPNDADETVGANKVFKDLAWGLATRGIAVLRYTKRTRQYGAKLTAIPNFTVKEETIEDAQHAVDLLAAQPEIDAKRICVVGHSLGALVAPRIAAVQPKIAGLVMLAGNSRPLEVLLIEQVEYLSKADGTITDSEQKQIDATRKAVAEIADPNLKPDQTIVVFGASVPGSYFIDLRAYQPLQVAAALKIPLLFLQGERDYQVRMADFESWKKALGNRENVAFKSYPPLNHLFIAGGAPGSGLSTPQEYAKPGHVAEEVLDDIALWVKERKIIAPLPAAMN
jgi:hypothetical protein